MPTVGPDTRTLAEKLPFDKGEVDFMEHSKATGAKKTVEVSPSIAKDPAAAKTIDPINSAAASGAFSLVVGKAYRVVSDGSIRFRLSNGTSAAAATDTYLPADMPVVVKMGQFDTLSFIRTGGTFVQAVEVK